MKMSARFPPRPKPPSFASVKLPGSQVEADTVLVEMSNPQLEQEALDAQLQVKAAEAEYQSLKVKLDSDLMTQKAGAATVNADYAEAQRQAQTDKALYDLGVISGLAAKASAGKAEELTTRNDIEDQRLADQSEGHRLAAGRATSQGGRDAALGGTQAEAVAAPESTSRG